MRARLLIPCMILLAYVYSFPYFGKLKSANELPRIFLTTEIVDHGTFRINRRLRDLGSRFDVAVTPAGDHYSNKAPGLSFLAVPAYLMVKGWHAVVGGEPSLRELTWMFRIATVTLPAVLFLPFFLAFARRFAPAQPIPQRAGLLALALGSLALPYSIVFFSHHVGAVCVALSFICAVTLVRTDVNRRQLWALATGGFAGLAVLIDYQAALGALAVGCYLLLRSPHRWRDAALALAGTLPAAILLASYHAVCFGSPLTTGYSFSPDPAHDQGVLGIIGPNATAAYNALLAPDNGLLVLSPWVLMAVLGGLAIARDAEARARVGAEALACAIIVAAYALFICSTVPEFGRGGWSVGPRYIAVAMPFCAWLAVAGFAAVDRRPAVRAVSHALVLVGVAVFVLAAATFPHWPWPNFSNPLYEVSLRAVAEGMAPYSLGTLVGLDGLAAYLPLFIGVTALAGWLLAHRDRRRWLWFGASALMAAAVVAIYSAFPREGSGAERGWRFIQSIWEP